jgi:hypothetical protein
MSPKVEIQNMTWLTRNTFWMSIFFLGAMGSTAFGQSSTFRTFSEGVSFADNAIEATAEEVCDFSRVMRCSAEASCGDSSGSCGSSNSGGCCDVCPSRSPSCWYFQAEALFLHRDNQVSDQPVVLDDVSRATLLSTGDLNGDWGVGQRYLLGRQLNECSAVEVSYFGIVDWASGDSVSGDNNLDIPPVLNVPGTDYDNADIMRITSSSRLNNVEINYVRTVCGSPCCGTSVLAGFRYVNFDDEFNLASDGGDGFFSNYNIKAKNNLYGAQLGLRTVRTYCRWGWDVTGKAGVFGNDAEQRQFVEDQPDFLIRPVAGAPGETVGSSDSSVAFVGDINASLVLRLTDTWSLRGGYNLMWIEGLALAGNQLDFTFLSDSGTGHSDSGGVFFHGASAGLQARW